MKSCVQDWFGSKLGIVVDMSPGHFGRLTKDGILLAKLLYSYGIIPLQIVKKIKPSKNVIDCYNNLKILKQWLEYLEVQVEDEILYEIASGQDASAINLFYALYLNLKHKDRLHYLCNEKLRKYSQDRNRRQINVKHVSEEEIKYSKTDSDSELAVPLIEKQNIISRHREKCTEILQRIKSFKENYGKSFPDGKNEFGPIASRHASSKKLAKLQVDISNTYNEINTFSSNFIQCVPNLNYEELIKLQNHVNSISPKPIPNFKEANRFVNFIKQKTRKEVITKKFQEDMQALVLDEMYSNIMNKQEDDFENVVCNNLLKQSQYEKQICSKLMLMRGQKDILMKNREKIERLSSNNVTQKEYEDSLSYRMEIAAEDALNEDFERQRIMELHKAMYVQKVKLKFQERLEEAKNILDKLIDIAIRIGEFREAYACEIPKHLMKDLKELFFNNMPIFDIIEEVENVYGTSIYGKSSDSDYKYELLNCGEGEDNCLGEDLDELNETQEKEECGENGVYDSQKGNELMRQEVLNECDFNDYMLLLGPWSTESLVPDEKGNVNQPVLGYIVHKLLEIKYPKASVPVPAELKPKKFRAVVQGTSDESILTMLREVMALRNILVVVVDDAINFVLRAYKSEISAVRDIDIFFKQVTKNALKGKGGMERTTEKSKKEQLLKKESVIQNNQSFSDVSTKEASTQTPRNIPEDDPLLTPNAEIGKTAFESLGIGDPVPDITVTSAIIAYIASLQDQYQGWVLWNYPISYSQASKLEFALTGYQLMCIDDDDDDDDDSIEVIEGFSCRSNCQNPHNEDDFGEKRISRLVQKPEDDAVPEEAESYFTAFVKIKKRGSESIRLPPLGKCQSDDCLERFYTEQNIFYTFDYSSITFQSVKDIGKVILGEDCRNDVELVPKPSVDIFGEGLIELNEKYSGAKKKAEKDVKKPVETIKKEKHEPGTAKGSVELSDEYAVVSGTKVEEEELISESATAKGAKPGDPGWVWAAGEQPEEIQLILAGFWEKLESVYIEDFKYIFFCLRLHRANILNYKAFLRKVLQNFLRREDTKQNILNEFQQSFNDIDDDLRPDVDVKSELHVRVSELEECLLEIADQRREKSDGYRIEFANDNWVAEEMTNLVNLYLRALQLETDRCIDTCQFINDYYLSLQQKIPHENAMQKIYAPTLNLSQRNYSIVSSVSKSFHVQNVLSSTRPVLGKFSKASFHRKGRHEKSTAATASQGAYSCSFQHETYTLPSAAEAVNDIFVTLSYSESDGTHFHKFFTDIATDLRNNVKDMVENCLTEARKGSSDSRINLAKDKKKTAEVKTEANAEVVAEWSSALETEISRYMFRMRLIEARGVLDFNELILAVLNTLISVTEEIGIIYDREKRSISECCKVIRCAIEEETPLQPRLELNVDEFAINNDVLLFPNPPADLTTTFIAPYSKFQFTIEQLTFIFKKLRYIAPDGEIVRRAFIYILEDFRVMKSEDGIPKLLPDIWLELDPNDIPILFDRLYQRTEIVNWKDFIVYALELPMPTDVDILNMRSNFRLYDQSCTELINFKEFLLVEFWFETISTRFETFGLKEFLFRIYQVDEEYTNYSALLLSFCKDDEDPFVGFLKALALTTGKKIVLDEYDSDILQEEQEEDDEEEEEQFMKNVDEEEELFTQSSTTHSNFKGRPKCKKRTGYFCGCKDPPESLSGSLSVSPAAENAGELYSLYFDPRESINESYVSDVPPDVIKKVLLSTYPSLPQLSILLSCQKDLEESIDEMLESVKTEKSTVKVSALFKHKLMIRLLTSTNKFKAVNLQNIVKSIVEEKVSENV